MVRSLRKSLVGLLFEVSFVPFLPVFLLAVHLSFPFEPCRLKNQLTYDLVTLNTVSPPHHHLNLQMP